MHGERYISEFVQKLAFGAYNKRFKTEEDPHAWLTTDRTMGAAYAADLLCTFRFTVSAMGDLMRLLKYANSHGAFAATKGLPVLLVLGTQDLVGNYGKGVIIVRNGMAKRGAEVTISL